MTTSNGRGEANDPRVVIGRDERSDKERAAEERRQAEETVSRLETKRDKAVDRLEDAERALAEAKAELEGGA